MKRTALALTLILVLVFSTVILTLFLHSVAQTNTAVTIKPDGSIEGTSQIQRQGNTYTLTGNLSGGITVQRSNIVIDGAGYAIKGGGEGIGIDLSNECWRDDSRAQIKNVTVKNLKIINFGHAIEFASSVNDVFIGNYVADCSIGFNIWHTDNHTLMHNTIENCVTGITISFGGSNNVITGNNIINSSVFVMKQSPDNTVDRNYWSDYLTKYPNAKEIGNTGIWDTPYEGHEAFTDNHPLVEPVAVNPESTDEPFPIALMIILVAIAITGMILIGYLKKRKRLTDSCLLKR